MKSILFENQIISIISLLGAIASAIFIAFDLRRRPQAMKIMNVVWILTALWSSLFGLLAYYFFGRERSTKMSGMAMSSGEMKMPKSPLWRSVTLSTLHCGAGCTLADIIGEVIIFSLPISIIGSKLAGGWEFNYILALIFGVWFQYCAIKPMSNLPNSVIVVKALKADFLSLTAWQVGMYGWIYLITVHLGYIDHTSIISWRFWFVMQQAMFAGFILSLPVNYLLIKVGIKSGM